MPFAETISVFIEAVGIAFSWPTFGWIIVGILLGIVIGALPGLGPSLGMAIMLPLTLPLEPVNAIILLVSVYSGAMYGGAIAAILINAPGTAAAAATTFDGYPMSRSGDAMKALSISATASSIAGFFTVITLILLSPVLVEIVLAFGSPERFLIALLGLAMITVIARGSMVKGITAGMFGLLITSVGTAPMAITPRYTFQDQFGFVLVEGIAFVAVLIGLFAIAEMFKLAGEKGGISQSDTVLSGSVIPGIRTVFSYPGTVLKSGYIGMAIGSIPGAGSTVSTFVAYGEAVRSAKDPETYGKGNEVGLIAAESSNNGTIGGSLIPTLSFGIPGSAATAVLLGGLVMHGLRPGPTLFGEELVTTYSLFIALLIGNVLILTVGLLLVTRASAITRVDTDYIIPIIIVLALVGAFALRGTGQNWLDVSTVVLLGIIGYYMKKFDYSIIAFVLGVVLGPIAEQNLDRSLQLSDGSWLVFFNPDRPLTIILSILIVIMVLGPSIKPYVTNALNRGS
ncbi:tripartite tricarboxylate transporter permease [Natronocalculus amylovorans]|uniref:Tripartite tricarboxylate transporter permease n=1 Tax=Natronocalculus amylovorans TaxID=2917812 RepID=A0AAE3K8T0_9EURY|nr:tripartite tricarboxylate transporter permease [Natronocalculus amylovorans]MCL9817363.1 tripartite tricarboxylate transporter permease [Natronocalculus amylovorans]